ncbi:hypothetical protein Pyrfu_0322 [Pyrolobus fumarii 1A]|uniref:Uncharacterized protein n=1 Tax=Pyrolobus fumarii (strain DSM 11204 / 1A) TaxID=694429 RepID=G0EFM3_PYRF1|nr:hypothetical protein Pyrfu_0322 [Pyrolobus fumarii 1A]
MIASDPIPSVAEGMVLLYPILTSDYVSSSSVETMRPAELASAILAVHVVLQNVGCVEADIVYLAVGPEDNNKLSNLSSY